ncbi:serine--tRNA ligase [candidate division KSB1 bacterium]|nr:serine--tRNA ligase [candidate division KSB1 bacterium]
MLDIKFIREHPDVVRKAAENKRISVDIDHLLELDRDQRQIQNAYEKLRQQRNECSLKINQLRKRDEDAAQLIREMKEKNQSLKSLKNELAGIDRDLYQLLITVPNIPHASVPVGAGESDNIQIRIRGAITSPDFQIKPHWEIGEQLGMIDFSGGSKLAGSFFINFKGWGARLERALINFMLDLHVKQHGYIEISPPLLVSRKAMFGTGQLPRLEFDMYRLERDDLFLIPTAEVPLTNLHSDEILDGEQLPINYVAYTPCFRRESGTHGRQNRGLVRIHQFDKIELVKLTEPETSYHELETLLADAEAVLQKLELPYQVTRMCTGELSFASAKCYDINVWSPAMNKYLEVASCCNFSDFQARRASIRYRPGKGKKPRFVHTLNASGVALPRTMIAILENYQTDRGTIKIPRVLQDYVGTDEIK